MPEGIEVLGESLLARAKESNKREKKANRREAYKIAFATGATDLINNTLNRRADQFLQNEQVLAAKGRYKANADQASQIFSMQEAAKAKNQSMEDFFFETRYMPAMEAEFQAKYGEEGFTVASYKPQMMAQARELARQEAMEFEQALQVANSLPSYEEAANNLDSLVSPPRGAGRALMGRVSDYFSGRDSNEVREEILQRVSEEGKITSDSAKVAFDRVLRDGGASAAAEFAEHFSGGKHADDKINSMVQITNVGNDVIISTVTTATDYLGNKTETLGDVRTIHTFLDPADRTANRRIDAELALGSQRNLLDRQRLTLDERSQRDTINLGRDRLTFDERTQEQQNRFIGQRLSHDIQTQSDTAAFNQRRLEADIEANQASNQLGRDRLNADTTLGFAQLSQAATKMAQDLRSSVDVNQLAVNTLTPEAYADWELVLQEQGINSTNLMEGNNWTVAGEEYSKLASNPQHIRDDVRSNNVAANQAALFEVFSNTIVSLESDPENLKKFIEQLRSWAYEWNHAILPQGGSGDDYGSL